MLRMEYLRSLGRAGMRLAAPSSPHRRRMVIGKELPVPRFPVMQAQSGPPGLDRSEQLLGRQRTVVLSQRHRCRGMPSGGQRASRNMPERQRPALRRASFGLTKSLISPPPDLGQCPNSESQHNTTLQFGGGLDLAVRPNFGVRVAADYRRVIRAETDLIRLYIGIVFPSSRR